MMPHAAHRMRFGPIRSVTAENESSATTSAAPITNVLYANDSRLKLYTLLHPRKRGGRGAAGQSPPPTNLTKWRRTSSSHGPIDTKKTSMRKMVRNAVATSGKTRGWK